MSKVENIKRQLCQMVDDTLTDDLVVDAVVENLRDPVRDNDAEDLAGDGFMRWKQGPELIIRVVVRLNQKGGE